MKHTITNRNGLKLVIKVDTPERATGLAFVAHGLTGTKDQVHIRAATEAFLDNGYRVISFDATHSIGESDGDVFDVTYDTYVSDLEDVIAWAKTQPWYIQPYTLCGHSMGAQSTTWYAENYPDEVAQLVALAPVVNYELYFSTMGEKGDQWKARGYKEKKSSRMPHEILRIGWGVVESVKQFNILPLADQLSMPVLGVVGEMDEPCPLAHQRMFFDEIASKDKTLKVIPGAQHSYRNANTLEYGVEVEELKHVIHDWLAERSEA